LASVFKQGNAWHIKFYFRGSPYKKSLGPISEHKAHRAMQRVEARLADLKAGFLRVSSGADLAEYLVRGEVVEREKVTQILVTFEAVKDSYLKYAEPRKAGTTFCTEKVHLRHFEQFLGARVAAPISEVTTADIQCYLTDRRQRVSGTTANKELQTIRQLFDFARRQGAVGSNPAHDVSRFKHSGRPHRFMSKQEIDDQINRGGLTEKRIKVLKRLRYLEEEEVTKLLDLAKERDPWLHPVLATLAFTGLRRGEVVDLEWGDVDFKAGKIWARSRKQSRTAEFAARDIDMHEKLQAVLRRHRSKNQTRQHVFPGHSGDRLSPDELHRAFKALIKGSDFDGIGLHCLRHSFASNLAAQGVDQRLIDHYMGHQTQEMRQRYQHLFPDKKSEGIQRLPY